MSLELTYKNDFGSVTMYGSNKGNIRICKLEGLGVVANEYTAVQHTGQNGQSTISQRAVSRAITMQLEVVGDGVGSVLRATLRVLSREGTLYIENENMSRRIYCNQVQIPDVERVLKGKISTFAVQFICDNPYFEDKTDTVCPLYGRFKRLSTPFSLPSVFGEIIAGAQLKNSGDMEVEPQITIYYPAAVGNAENVTITNRTTDKSICLDYAPQEDDTIIIDVKNRSITSSKTGNLLNHISIGTFLGDFVFVRGTNHIEISLGDVTAGFSVECRYANLHQEALIV